MRTRPSRTSSTSWLWAKSLLNAVLFFLIFMVALPWGADRLAPNRLPLPAILSLAAGGLLAAAGLVVWCWCLDIFSRQGKGTPFPLDAPRLLVTTGPFAIVRNPIIGAELLVIWGEAAYFATVGIMLYAVVATVAAHLAVVYGEEPDLRRRFGRQYEEYARRVPRWLPRLRRRPGIAEP